MNDVPLVFIGGVARSGTSWLGQIFDSAPDVAFRFQPLFSYELKGSVDDDSDESAFARFTSDLLAAETDFLTQADRRRSGEYPTFDKTAPSVLVAKENRYQSVMARAVRLGSARMIGVVRHPAAVLWSWSRNEREFPAGSVLEDEWRFGLNKNQGPEDYFGFYRWKEVANLYVDLADQHPDRFLLTQYERLVESPAAEAQRLFEFCGLEVATQTEDFLDASTTRSDDSYYSVYRRPSENSAWRTGLPSSIVDEIERELRGTRLERFLD